MYFASEPLQAAKQHVCLVFFKDCRNVAVSCLSMCRKKMYLNKQSAKLGFKTGTAAGEEMMHDFVWRKGRTKEIVLSNCCFCIWVLVNLSPSWIFVYFVLLTKDCSETQWRPEIQRSLKQFLLPLWCSWLVNAEHVPQLLALTCLSPPAWAQCVCLTNKPTEICTTVAGDNRNAITACTVGFTLHCSQRV